MIGSVIIILVPEICTVDIFNPLFKHLINCIWRGQAHPRSQRSHVIGRRLGMGAAHWPGAARRVAPVRDPCLCSGQMFWGSFTWDHLKIAFFFTFLTMNIFFLDKGNFDKNPSGGFEPKEALSV